MPDEEKKDADKKVDALREIQNRIMALENEIKSVKGTDAANLKAIAREEVKALEAEIAGLKTALAPTPAPVEKKEEGGLLDWWPF